MSRGCFKAFVAIALCLLFATDRVWGQYTESGNTPTNINWDQLKGENRRIVFPSYFRPKAEMVGVYMDSLDRVITTGLNAKIDNLPVVLIPTRAQSNGMVTWAPKRMELYTAPPTDTHAIPWLKQLTTHEYRHVVQLSNLNQGFTKGFSYLLGEQALGLVAYTLPGWFLEGDASLAETQLFEYGRGKQPEFSIGYRAILNELDNKDWDYEKLKAGTFRLEYPSMYEMGYFITLYGQTFYSPRIWAEMVKYIGRNPYMIIPDYFFFKNRYKTSTSQITEETFTTLRDFWHKSSQEPNSTSFIDSQYRWYRKNEFPLMVDSTTVLSLYRSMDYPQSFRFSSINGEGKEQVAENSVYLNSRPLLKDSTLYWTEYQPSKFWEQSVRSVIRTATIKDSGKRQKLVNHKTFKNDSLNYFFVTPLPENQFAYIAYGKHNNPHLIIADSRLQEISRGAIKGWSSSVNGLAYDNLTDRLYFFLVNDDGISLEAYDYHNNSFETIKEPSLVTQRNLSAKDGKLYFSSIASGKDEAHIYDLLEKKEYQLTSSQYGSFSPTPIFTNNGDSLSVVTTYKLMGYELATQKVEQDELKVVEPNRMPNSRLNPSWYNWDVMKMDTVNTSPKEAEVNDKYKFSKKRPFILQPHSWLPLCVDVPELVEEYNFEDIKFGATIMSQDILGNLTATAGYGYVMENRMNMLFGTLNYGGLPVKLDGEVVYGGALQITNLTSDHLATLDHPIDNYFSLSMTASLPMNLSSGKRSKILTPYIGYGYNNSLLMGRDGGSIIEGENRTSVGFSWASGRYAAPRDLASPFSYYFNLSALVNLTDFDQFGRVYSLLAGGTVPGIFNNHSVLLKGAAQIQEMGLYNFNYKSIYPIGCNYNNISNRLVGASISYRLPFVYPDGGIPSVVFFKRISGSLDFQYANNEIVTPTGFKNLNPYSYGGKLKVDCTLLGSTTVFTAEAGIFIPSDSKKPVYTLDFGFTL